MMKAVKVFIKLISVGLFSVIFMGCYAHQMIEFKDGTKAYFAERTNVFGHDVTIGYFQPAPYKVERTTTVPSSSFMEAKKVKLEGSYSCTNDSWKQGCPSPKQRKDIKHSQKVEKWTRDVIVPVQVIQPTQVQRHVELVHPPAVFYGGGNPSVGNLFAPAAAIGAGFALQQPAKTYINQNQSGGGAKIGDITTQGGNAASFAEGGDSFSKSNAEGGNVRLRNSNVNVNKNNFDSVIKVNGVDQRRKH